MSVISESDLRAFDADGVVPLRGVLDSDLLHRLEDAVERDIENPGPFFHGYESEEGRFHGNLRIWQNDATFYECCIESELPYIAQQFFGSKKINLLYDQLFVKEASMSQRTSLAQ